MDRTYYEILEISPTAGEHEIRRAYQRAKETYSPNSPALYTMFSPDEAQELSRLIEEAYAVLSNHQARTEYNFRMGFYEGSTQPVEAQLPTSSQLPHSSSPPQNVAPSEGYGKTRLGVYPLDEMMEEEIANYDSFDGSTLAKIREYKKVEVPTLCEEIKISKAYLKAIETDDYERLPAQVFVRGFVKHYAKALCLDEQKVVDTYMQRLKNARL